MSGAYLLTDLPSEILENVLSYLSYDEIAKYRVVCRKFDTTCKVLLNHGFFDMERRHAAILKKVKSLLPRRESERRTHPLARHSDILIAIETRISMLRMTFAKYVDKNSCCFIPGKVIDEILRVLKIVVITKTPPRTHEILQELRDISSMAMEHFDEKIAPHLINPFSPPVPIVTGPSLLKLPIQDLFVNNAFRKDFKLMQQQSLAQKKQISCLKEIVGKLCHKLKKQNRVMNIQTRKILNQSAKIKHQENSIADLKRHVEEWDTKFQDLVQNLKCSRDEVSAPPTSSQKSQTAGSLTHVVKSAIDTVGASSTTPIMYKPNIKPRKAQILTSRSLSSIELAPLYDSDQRKRKIGLGNSCDSSSTSSVPAKLSRLQFLTNYPGDVIDEPYTDGLDTDRLLSNDPVSDTHLKNYQFNESASLLKLPSFLTSGIETLLKSPISSIRSRKRKLQ